MKKIVVLLMIIALTSAFSQVKEYFITCNPDDFKSIYKNFDEDTYINISLAYQDKIWNNIRLRIRGDDTRKLPKKSLKIKFADEPFIDGKNTLNFNAEYEDESYINQFLSSLTFQKAGYPCYKTEHARLYLNGKYLGLYLRVENIDEQFLEANSLDTKGNLYKATEDDACLSIYEKIDSLWEKKTNENAPWDDLYALRDSLFYVSDYDYYEFAKRTFDYNKMVDILAINFLISHGSTYYHNYYMYHDINRTGKWFMLPWDMDKSFFKYGYKYNYHRSSSYNSHDNPFMERAIICDPIFEDIKSRIDNLSEDFFNSRFFDPIIDSLANLISSSVEQDETDNIPDMGSWQKCIDYNKQYVKERYNNLKWQLNSLPRSFRVEPTFGTKFLPYKFVWHPSKNPDGTAPKYKFYIGKQKHLEELAEFSVTDLTDTTYTLETLADTGLYYWKIMAYNSAGSLDGFDYPNIITIKNPNELPCEISTDMTLSKDNSPYTVNCDVIVSPEAELIIEKGVEIVFTGYYQLQIKGSLQVRGTEAEPVRFSHNSNTPLWQNIYFHFASSPCSITNAIIENGSIYSQNSILSLESIKLNFSYQDTAYAVPLIFLDRTQCSMNNSIIKSNGMREGFIIKNADSSSCKNSYFENVPDAIEFTSSKDGMIFNNTIIGSTDDGIDLNGCNNIQIINNKIFKAFDKGISLGNEGYGYNENIILKANIIVGCEEAISVKDSSSALIINNTLFDNTVSIHCYEKRYPQGGGFAILINNILISDSLCLSADKKSYINTSYSLANDTLIPGTGNLIADPKFIDSGNFDFRLESGSPCIDAGDPNSELDADGTRADIGAIYYSQKFPKIVINEINYNSAPESDSEDWVELYNNDDKHIDISGWIFKDSDDSHAFVLPDNIILKAGDYLILCADTVKFKNIFKTVYNKIGNTGFGLSGSGELIRLFDNHNKLIDYVEYDDKAPWDESADGKGHSLELINPELDNTLAESWRASVKTGTPGYKNSIFLDTSNKYDISNKSNIRIFPNPASDYFIIEYPFASTKNLTISIIDAVGNEYKCGYNIITQKSDCGYVYIKSSNLSQGVYFLKINSDNHSYSEQIVILK